MNKGFVIGIAIVVAIVAALSIVAARNKAGKAPAAPDKPSTQQEAKAPAAIPPAATPPAATPAAAPTAAAPALGTPITAATIVGTQWAIKNFVFDFNADGALRVNSMMDGKWTIEGGTLTVAAMGQELKAKIDGDKITYNGEALVRKK